MGLSPGVDGRQGRLAGVVALLGRAAAWLTLAMTLLTFLVVVLRYGLNEGWIWMQESVTYLHATVFMVAAAWAFQADEHVRVDILYRNRSERYRRIVDLAGTLVFLVPFSLFLIYYGWDYVVSAWVVREASSEPGGLPLVWLLKTLVLVMPALLLAQAGVTVAQCWRYLAGEPVEG